MKDYTEEFLRCISDHLSSRKSCRKVEYVVAIGMMYDDSEYQMTLADLDEGIHDKIFFSPPRFVFPDKFHRSKGDYQNIVNHVIKSHFHDTIFDREDSCKDCRFKEGSLSPGIYKYKNSFNSKRRKWIRCN